MPRFQTFSFERYRFDPDSRRLTLQYALDDSVRFTESFRFDFDFADGYSRPALERALFGLFLMAGVSYYKTYVPPKIRLRESRLSPGQAAFFAESYEHGLGEFFYRNRLRPRAPAFEGSARTPDRPVRLPGLKGAVVPIGGGKDSIVAAELMRSSGREFATWNVRTGGRIAPLVRAIGAPHLHVDRTVAPNIGAANRQGAYNGHVPITGILMFLATVTAILTGRKDVVFANESSANEPNLTYRGRTINHQYSKSLVYERRFQQYLRRYVSPDLRCFSVLRPLSELAIAEVFCERYLETYAGAFSSCNRNFKLSGRRKSLGWCGECPKCAFVFALFSPFVTRERLLALFGGRNLFEQPALDTTFRELLGITGTKPFECVGEIREVRAAVTFARRSGNYPELDRFRFPPPRYDYRRFRPHAMPPPYLASLKRFLKR